MSEPMSDEKLKKMRVCVHLLPPPGGEVVKELLDEIDRLQAENADLLETLSDFVVQACQVTGKDGAVYLDSYADSSNAYVMRILAERGKIRITSDVGRRVIAHYLPEASKEQDA